MAMTTEIGSFRLLITLWNSGSDNIVYHFIYGDMKRKGEY